MIDFAIRAGQICCLMRNASDGWEEIAYARTVEQAATPSGWQIVGVENGADRVKLRRWIAQIYVAHQGIKRILQ